MTRLLASLVIGLLMACGSGAEANIPVRTAEPPVPPVANAGHPSPAPVPADSPTSLAGAHNRFAFDLYGEMRAAPGNLAFSPASISMALSMTYAGAHGETAAQMARTLHIGALDDMHGQNAALLSRWRDPSRDTYELRVANRLFGEQSAHFHPPFVTLTGEHYGAPLEPVDFVRRPDISRRRINTWVEQQTNQRIQNLLPDGSIDSLVRLVLTNAIYFKGRWQIEFDEDATRDRPFQRANGVAQAVPTMHQHAELPFADLDGLDALELPYVGDDLSMVLLLPDTPDGLGALEERLSAEQLERWIAALQPQYVQVALPRFRVDPPRPTELKPMLMALGMELPFQTAADFGGMADIRPLFIQEVFHKAFVEVNEEGTEAAAATAVIMRSEGAIGGVTEFIADHPFLFLIRDRGTGSILFLGRVTDPSE